MRDMPPLRTLLHIVHVLALAAWAGAVLMSAAVAASVFPLMKSLDPIVPSYAAYTGPHSFIVAGHVAARTFLIADIIQFAAALLALASFAALVLVAGRAMHRALLALRGITLSAAVSTLAFQLLVLAPRMNKTLGEYWSAAQTGDNPRAATLRADFQLDHPTASGLLAAIGLSVLASLVLALLAESTRDNPAPPREASTPRLEEPALLRSAR